MKERTLARSSRGMEAALLEIPDAVPMAPFDVSRASVSSLTRGCLLTENSYRPDCARGFDIVFFREDFSGDGNSRRTVSPEHLAQWLHSQEATRAKPPVVGIYLPFTGAALYDLLSRLRLGFASVGRALPDRVRRLAERSAFSQICIPALLFLIADKERWHWNSTDDSNIGKVAQEEGARGAARAWGSTVTAARLMEHPEPTEATLAHEQPRVRLAGTSHQGYLHFDVSEDMGSAAVFQREPEARLDAPSTKVSPRDLAAAVNALGIRVYVSVPLDLLRGDVGAPPSLARQRWREELLHVAREVSLMQGTPVLGIETRQPDGGAEPRLPRDVLRVSPGVAADSNTAWTFLSPAYSTLVDPG